MPKFFARPGELVFSPNHSGYNGIDDARHNDFLECCEEGVVSDWTCKQTAAAGDVYLFWFCQPVDQLAGFAVSTGLVKEHRNQAWDWTPSRKGWFCAFCPAIALDAPIGLEAIRRSRLLAEWWRGRPFQGRPKRIVDPAVARKLCDLIVEANSENEMIEVILAPFRIR